MFCPNCGVEIHIEGSFCAKCRKNVAYLTQAAAEVTEPADDGESTVQPESPKEDKPGFFCNYCGTFVYPEDNYCYQCGKKTRKEFYNPDSSAKKSFFSLKSK